MPSKIHPTSVRILDNTKNWLNSGIFDNRHLAARIVLNSTPDLYAITLHEIKGRFNGPEIDLLLDVARYVDENDQTGQGLIRRIDQELATGSLAGRTPDLPGFISRIRRLTVYQGAALQWWAGGYHNLLKRIPTSAQDIQDYLNTILADDTEEEA